VNCKTKFTRSHAHLFHFVKDPKKFTYLSEQLENRVPSARLVVYGDSRGNPNGRLPDDTWILRPQDLAGHFTPEEDTWYFPRVAGTFKERAGFHGCQMPEQLLGRIIRICSHENEIVLDPFSGSATTLAVAKKLGRRSLGFDLSPDYVKRGTDRLAGIRVGDPLDGAPEPTMSALSTANGKKLADKLNGHPAAPLTKRGIFGKIPRKPPEKPMPLFEAAKNTKRSRTALKATTNNKPRSSKSQSSKSQSSKPKSSRRKAK
jgi:site-specific DNA-methyltransferase (adenine-specific)